MEAFIGYMIMLKYINMQVVISSNSEAKASELLENMYEHRKTNQEVEEVNLMYNASDIFGSMSAN